MTSKICSKCKKEKPLECFSIIKSRGKLYAKCKLCLKQAAKEKYERTKHILKAKRDLPENKAKLKTKNSLPENKEKRRNYDKKYKKSEKGKSRSMEYSKRPEVKEKKKIREQNRIRLKKIKESKSDHTFTYKNRNETIKIDGITFKQSSKEGSKNVFVGLNGNKIKKCSKCSQFLQLDRFRLKKNKNKRTVHSTCKSCEYSGIWNQMRNALRVSIRIEGKSASFSRIFKALGYSAEELKSHIESLFEPWMNWNNWGRYDVATWNDNDSSTWVWNLDHIIPHSEFDYKSLQDESFKQCWALANLRPLSAKQNIIEGVRRVRHASFNKQS